jgi:prepilin-type N-terminal cleavage/methylation domain-containing protein
MMHRIVLAKTTGFTLIEMTIVMAIIASLAAIGLPTFVTYRDRSRVAQVIGSSDTIRAALASYAASNPQNGYPSTGMITDFDSLRLVVNDNGGLLGPSTVFSVSHYAFYDGDGDGIADTYSMRLIVNGVSSTVTGAQLLITPEGISRCTTSGNPC